MSMMGVSSPENTDATEHMTPGATLVGPGERRISRGRRVGVAVGVVAALVAAGGIAWTWQQRDDKVAAQGSQAAVRVAPPASILTAAELVPAAAKAGHPSFWLGPKTGMQYEFSLGSDGASYVRYLTPGVKAGDPRANFTLVGTYSDTTAYQRVVSGSKRKGAVKQTSPSGALVESDAATSLRAYMAFPQVPLLVEIYDPNPGRAFSMASKGEVVLIPSPESK